MKSSPRVFVGLSGGVDSSVAALRLKRRGYEVVGVFIKVWHPDWLVCNWEAERLDAMRVAAHLNIPFLTCDAEAEYRDGVAKYFIAEYAAGRTPNPDVMCNKHVKFGAFLRFAKEHGADYIATGHYARRFDNELSPELHRGIDGDKDQSYFLWTLTNEQLAYTLLPIGDTIKDHVRKEAAQAGIPTALKKDSQGICFLGHVDIREFLSHYTALLPGRVITEAGEQVGTHHGALIYTPGQRHGLTITSPEAAREPYYVVGKDIEKNIVTVSHTKPVAKIATEIHLDACTLRTPLAVGQQLEAQTRYRQTPFLVQVTGLTPERLTLTVASNTDSIVTGQSCVLYLGTHCVGGGIIA
jgi:tRNA-uridine 2-sulfurtransferase